MSRQEGFLLSIAVQTVNGAVSTCLNPHQALSNYHYLQSPWRPRTDFNYPYHTNALQICNRTTFLYKYITNIYRIFFNRTKCSSAMVTHVLDTHFVCYPGVGLSNGLLAMAKCNFKEKKYTYTDDLFSKGAWSTKNKTKQEATSIYQIC